MRGVITEQRGRALTGEEDYNGVDGALSGEGVYNGAEGALRG